MTNKQLKLIYEYMEEAWGWDYAQYKKEIVNIPDFLTHPLDSNSAWECVQEMERKGDADAFELYLFQQWEKTKMYQCQLLWQMNPTNFLNTFSKWLE